jgi:hypothetical protein
MRRHDKVRQDELLGLAPRRGDGGRIKPCEFGRDRFRREIGKHLDLPCPRRLRAMVGKVDDLALSLAFDRRMRRVNEAA